MRKRELSKTNNNFFKIRLNKGCPLYNKFEKFQRLKRRKKREKREKKRLTRIKRSKVAPEEMTLLIECAVTTAI